MMSRDGLSANAMASGAFGSPTLFHSPKALSKTFPNSVIPLLQVVISLNLEIRYLVDK